MLIAIDGPAGSGKSTVARRVAAELGLRYMDSGAMYRSLGLLSLAAPARDPAALAQAATIEPGERVLLDGRDVTAQIRTPQVSEAASQLAAQPQVRKALVAKQRELLADGDWVAEGRDMATVVAPHAPLKLYLDASPQERARRRARELGADEATVLAELTLRDERDRSREHSPLRPAPGAVTLDTDGLDVEQVVARVLELAPRGVGKRGA
jgi:CMP/dCMP kinase